MGNVEIAGSGVQMARGAIAASAHKVDVLLSWDIESTDSTEQRVSSGSRLMVDPQKLTEISNGLLLQEVLLPQLNVCDNDWLTYAFHMSSWEESLGAIELPVLLFTPKESGGSICA
jgi:hypothetical protein